MPRRRIAVVLISLVVLAAVIGVGLLVGVGGSSSEKSLERARAYREQGELSASIIELKNLLRSDPENSAARISLGRLYLELRDLTSAEKELERARAYGAALPDIAAPLAQTWLLQNQFQKVLDELSADGLDAPTRAVVLVAHARALTGLDRLDDAQAAVAQALLADPANTDAWIERARLAIRTNDFAAARDALAKLAELAPDNLEAVALQGDLDLRAGRYGEAAAAYRRVIARLPAHLPTQVALANALIDEGAEAEARGVLARALDEVPSNGDANYLNAVIALRNGDYEGALGGAERALRSNPRHVPSLLVAGAAEFALGQLELAEREMRQVLAAQPDHPFASQVLQAIGEQRARRARGRTPTTLIDDSSPPATVAAAIDGDSRQRDILATAEAFLARRGASAGSGNPAAATATREAAAALRQGNAGDAYRRVEPQVLARTAPAPALMIAGAASLLRGEANQARLIFRSLEEVEPGAAEVQYLLALAYHAMDDQRSYADRLGRSLAIDPRFAPAIAETCRAALADARLADAATALAKLGEIGSGATQGELAGGLALLRGDLAAAETRYREVFSRAPSSLQTLRLAYVAHRLGRPADSQAVLQTWLDGHPGDVAVTLALANKRLAAGALVDAAELYSAALLLVPDHLVAINNLAWTSLRLGDRDAALRLARQGAALAPDDARLMDTLAEILMADGRYAEALPLLKRAAQRQPGEPGLQVRLARTLKETGNLDDARTVVRQVLDSYAAFPERAEAEQLAAALQK